MQGVYKVQVPAFERYLRRTRWHPPLCRLSSLLLPFLSHSTLAHCGEKELSNFSSAAEEAIEAAMMRSSSPLEESPLGKRAREEDDSIDQEGSEPDEEPASPQHQQIQPSLSNVIASTLRYASRKKLRPEQRDEVEAFLSVSYRHSLQMLF